MLCLQQDETIVRCGIRAFVEQHINDVIEVLSTIKSARLTISAAKSKFAITRAEILGYICTPQGRTPAEDKINKISNWPIPKTKTDVRSFVATCSFYRVWIPNFSTIAEPLYYLQKKKVIFHWNEPQIKAFKELK